MDIAEQEVGGVDQNGAVWVLGDDGEAGEDGGWKRLLDGAALGGVGRGRSEALVGFDEEEFGSGALETDDALGGEAAAGRRDLATVEAEVVRADAEGKSVNVEEVCAAAVGVQRDLKVELAGADVDVEGEEASRVLHAGGFAGDAGESGRGLREG